MTLIACLHLAPGSLLPTACIAAEPDEPGWDAGAALRATQLRDTPSATDSRSLPELAQEAEQRCRDTAESPPTPASIMEAVETACLLLQMEGMDAIRHFRGGSSPFIFGGTYIWIHDLSGVMIVHPIRHELEGLNVIGLKDAKGHRLFAEMNAAVLESGSSWVSYHWPRPGERQPSAKRSYVRLCEVEGRMVVIGCGLNFRDSDEDAEEAEIH